MHKIRLSPYHKVFYYEWKINPASTNYNIVFDQTLSASLNLSRLKKALYRFVSDYLLLNSHVQEIENELYWVKNNKFQELECFSQNNNEQAIKDYVIHPFNLQKGPLYRFGIFYDANGNYRFIIVFHHILLDGNSFDKLIAEISSYYNDYNYQFELTLSEQHEAIVASTNHLYSELEFHASESKHFWQNALSDVEAIDLRFLKPASSYKSSDSTNNIKELQFCFAENIVKKLNQLKNSYGLSIYQYSQIIFAILLNRYTGQERFAISYPIAVKEHLGLMYGAGVNTSVFPYVINNKITSTLDLITQSKVFIRNLRKASYSYRYYPINEIIAEGGKDLLNTFFAQTCLKLIAFSFADVEVISINHSFNLDLPAKLVFEQELKDKLINYRVRYNELEVDEVILHKFVNHYKRLFISVSEDLSQGIDERLISGYKVLDKLEYNQIIYKWNQTNKYYQRDKTIHRLFEEQVLKTPNNIALVYEGKQLTYLELNQRSNQLASYIMNRYSIKPDDLIALCLERNEYVIITILAVLKSGAAYVPIDPSFPNERIKYVLEDTEAKIILTNQIHEDRLSSVLTLPTQKKKPNVIPIDEAQVQSIVSSFSSSNPNSQVTSANLAYAIFTSGTTGKPKGVLIEHRSVVNLVEMQVSALLNDRMHIYNCLWFSNYVFDAHVWEIYATILSGSRLFIISNDDRQDIKKLCDYVKEKSIEIATITPTLLNNSNILNLKVLIVAGEQPKQSILNKYIESGIKVINAYGPTEGTVCVSTKYYEGNHVNIGKPIPNAKCYVLNSVEDPIPIGAIGELYIGGEVLAREYLNKPELTVEKFVINHFQSKEEKKQGKNKRLYKTGDLVRYLIDGSLEYIRRNDSQLKIRGCRIELSEIEAMLMCYPSIKQVAVVALSYEGDAYSLIDNKHLVAYYVADVRLDEIDIRSYLAKELPYYMIPARFIQLEKLPLTINGKLNWRELPRLGLINQISYDSPTTEQEQLICESFSQVLGIKQVGINDDFFQLGGNSINAIALSSILQGHFNIHVSDIFDLRTPKKLAEKAIFKINFIRDRLRYLKSIYKDSQLIEGQLNKQLTDNLNGYFSQVNNIKLGLPELKPIRYILLTGATGFLGCNILYQLLKETLYPLFLLIRAQSKAEAMQLLTQKFQFYFNEDLNKFYTRICIINGDLEEPTLGLTNVEYQDLAMHIDSIIHCAALVKHYGDYNKFYSANVQATINLLELSKLTKLKDFHYISTKSVLHSNVTYNHGRVVYTEDSIVTDFPEFKNNIYNYTKFLGEQQTIKYRKYGIKSNIYRIGNLAFIAKNSMPQQNVENNAFFYWLKCIYKVNCIAKELNKVEISPADLTAKAIIKIFDRVQLENGIYHVFNPYRANLAYFLTNYRSIPIKLLSITQFVDCLSWYLNNKIYYNLIMRFLLRQGWLNSKIDTANVLVFQERTQHILKQLGFKWYPIKLRVFKKYLENVNDNLFDYTGMNIMVKKAKIFEYLSIVAPIVPAPIYWLDTNNVLLGANEASLHMVGVNSFEDIIGKKAYDVYPQEIADHIVRHDNEVMRTGKILSQEEMTKSVNTGAIGYVLSIKAPLRDEDGNIVGIVGTSVDITAQKEAELLRLENEAHKVAAEEQAKFRKIADQVAHDIRSPLTTMQMVLPHCSSLPENLRTTLNKSATRIADVANNLLSQFSPKKHEQESLEAEETMRQTTLISAEILEVLTEKKYEYSKLAVDFISNISQAGYFAFININVTAFKRTISNLINNAVDALNSSIGEIVVHLDVNNGLVKITIQDNGKGMPQAIINKIMSAVEVTSGKKDGHGIGLAQVRDTLANNEGKLAIESTVGIGTKITLTFPKVEAPEWIAETIELNSDDVIVILDDDDSIHGAWDARFDKAASNIKRYHFKLGDEAVNFLNNLSDKDKEKVFLLTDYELLKQELHGLDVIGKTKIKRSILVTSHHNNQMVRDLAKVTNTKILPKPLASEVQISVHNLSKEMNNETLLKKVDLVFVDDDKELVNNFMMFVLNNKVVDKYYTPQDLINNLSQYPKDTKFLIDNQFQNEETTGLHIAQQLHDLGYTQLYLFSGTDFSKDSSIPSYLNLILKTNIAAIESLVGNKPKVVNSQAPISETVSTNTDKVDIVFLEDEASLRGAVPSFCGFHNQVVEVYSEPTELLKSLDKYSKNTKFVLDYQIGKDKLTGIDIAKQLHELGFRKLYLFSGTKFAPDKLPYYLTPVYKGEDVVHSFIETVINS